MRKFTYSMMSEQKSEAPLYSPLELVCDTINAFMITSVYFDIDATLIDIKSAQDNACMLLYGYGGFGAATNEQAFVATWDRLTEYHYDFYTRKEITYEEQRERRITDLYQTYDRPLGGDDPLELYDKYLRVFEDSWRIYDDVLPCLEQLASAGYRLGVITNGDKAQQTQKLERTNIAHYFSDIIAGGDYDYSKPDPRIFETACKTAGITYDNMCYIGDDLSKDIAPCNLLGIKNILIDRTDRYHDDPRLTRVTTLLDVNKLLGA